VWPPGGRLRPRLRRAERRPRDRRFREPMRTLGPALVAGHFDAVRVCIVSPIAGGVLAALLYDNFIPEAETPN
jgi:hypothetical protein